jgi:hypothetical protein
MGSAFHSLRHTLRFGSLLLVALTLPLIVRWFGPVTLEQSYRGISERAGAFDYIRRQIFDETSDVDILFCGSSLMGNAIDPGIVQAKLSAALGRPAKVVLLPQSWQGPDMNYFVSRDFMEHRKVKMLVIAAPALVHHSSQPHVQIFRIIRYGDHPGALDGLSLRGQLAFYAANVLGAPRQALNRVRENLVDPEAGRTLEYGTRHGYNGGPFIPRATDPAAVNPQSAVYTGDSQGWFRFEGPELNDFQLHFLRKTAELTRSHGALLVVLHMPSPGERGQQVVPDRRRMTEILGPGVMFAGVPSAEMFAGVPQDQVLDYFQDEHLNANGMALFTKTIDPMLAQLYERLPQSR